MLTLGLTETGERNLRRRIDTSVSRALFDREYAELLLADPTILLDDQGCTPQQYLELRGIRAQDIKDFASQAEALFWPSAAPRVSETRPALAAAF
ncbi:MAG TPA: hypothetical protein VFA49_03715 [Chloroflexota bacterium]|nr:hypothetical protein [Chloroflexota bacterium]